MIIFITTVKPPEKSQSYEKVWRMLNDTLFSVCSQIDQDFRVIVVCDLIKPLFHHSELINKYTEFIEVDFPTPGKDVIENFNLLGNLTPAFDDQKWWVNKRDTTERTFIRSPKIFLKQIFEKFLKEKNFYKLRSLYQNIKGVRKNIHNFKEGNKTTILKEDYFYIANVVLNKASKLLMGILAAKKYNPEYVMFFDADDYIGNDIAAYVNSHPGENGWIMAHGYKISGNRIAPYYRKDSICGTGNIFNFSLLTENLPKEITEKSTQNEIFKFVDSEFLITVGKHRKVQSYFQDNGFPFLEYPTRSVVQLLGHNESSQEARRIIRGASLDPRIKTIRKDRRYSPISSALVHYFNVLPINPEKVFCIGFHKTGTSSIDALLRDMGYQVARHYKSWDEDFYSDLKRGDLSELKEMSELFDGFQDIPWFLFYKEFDQWYPGSKFILTTRNSQSWWTSFMNCFINVTIPLFDYIYGQKNPAGHKKIFVDRYNKHNQDVKEYFKNRQEDLLIIDIGEKDSIQNICNFLGKSSNYKNMPHKNAQLNKSKKGEIINIFNKIIKTKNKKIF